MKRKNCRVIIEEGDEVIPETPEKINRKKGHMWSQNLTKCHLNIDRESFSSESDHDLFTYPVKARLLNGEPEVVILLVYCIK
jgi:hypothetical protein